MDELSNPNNETSNRQLCGEAFLTKSSRVGGPVTCVSFAPPRQGGQNYQVGGNTTTTLLWALGPYLQRINNIGVPSSTTTTNQNDELLVFPMGGSIHSITYISDNNNSISNNNNNKKHIGSDGYFCFDSVVFGGYQLAFCNVLGMKMERFDIVKSSGNDNNNKQSDVKVSDWIWDVTFVDSSNSNSKKSSIYDDKSLNMVLGLAHHKIEIWNVDTMTINTNTGGDEEQKQLPTIKVSRQVRIDGTPCVLLTSMHLFVEPAYENSLTVAAGSSFHNIHIWSIDGSNNNNNEEAYCLKGHAGVIHCVKFSSDGQSLASTSDDRSVRLWKKIQMHDDNDTTTTGSSRHLWTLQWTGWGHSARVWSVAFVEAPTDTVNMVASVAEDGKLLIWCCHTGTMLSSIQHSCSLWSIDVTYSQKAGSATDEIKSCTTTAIVGTCQGTMAIYDLDARINGRKLFISEDIAVPDDRRSHPTPEASSTSDDAKIFKQNGDEQDNQTPPKKKSKKKKKVSAQVIVGLDWSKVPVHDGEKNAGLVLATRAGSLMKYYPETKEWNYLPSWWESSDDINLDSSNNILATDGCCMALSDEAAAIGTTKGHIILVSLSEGTCSTATRRCLLSGAANLKSAQSLEWTNNTTLISFHVRGVAIWIFPSSPLSSNLTALQHHPAYVLNKSDTNRGVPMCCAYDVKKQIAVVGDSRGTVSLFDLSQEETIQHDVSECPHVCDAISSIARVHQKEHVTKIAFIGGESNTTICSVGNDGNLHISYILPEGKVLAKGWSRPASTMTGISNMILVNSKDSNKIYVSGYYGNTYRMIDMTSGHEFFSVSTGGRQRIHAFDTEIDTQGQYPATIQMAVCRNNKDGTNTLALQRLIDKRNEEESPTWNLYFHQGMCIHSATIFSACFFSLGGTVGGEGGRSFLLTGSEDCSSKISLWENGKCIESIPLTPQESCVRAVCTSQFDETCALLVVGGGKLVLQFFFVSPKQSNNGPGDVITISDLKIHFRGHGVAKRNCTIDHRINDVKALPLNDDSRTHLVVACDSDGNCHLFLISELASRPGIPPGILVPTSPRPLLCVDMVRVGNRVLILLGTTGGQVLIFDLPGVYTDLVDAWSDIAENWKEFTSFQGHQMGTNAICASLVSSPFLRRKEDGDGKNEVRVRICSGGDDQAICICELRAKVGGGDCLVLIGEPRTWIKREASFSAIKGIFDYYREIDRKRIIISVGYSQQLVTWLDTNSEEVDGTPDLNLLDRVDVDLGDINTFAVDTSSDSRLSVAVCGLGVECVSLTI